MIPEDDWYDVAEDDSAIEPSMLAMPLYDEDGNEIPEEELPWNNMTDECSSVMTPRTGQPMTNQKNPCHHPSQTSAGAMLIK